MKDKNTICKSRILIVEDDEMLAKSSAQSLKSLGYEVVANVTSGQKAILIAGESKPDLVLTGVNLAGEMDGIEAATRIRSFHDAAIVYLTAEKSQDVFERAKKTQPQAYMTKPISPQELGRTVDMALYRHEADTRVKKREERFREFLAHLGDAAYESDLSGNLTYTNRMGEVLTGLPLKDIIGKPFLPLFAKDSQEIAIHAFQRTLNGESPEYELMFTNGKIGHFKNEPLRDESGGIIGVFGIARDITERKKAEEALRESEQRLELALKGTNMGLWDLNVTTGKFFLDPYSAEIFGYSLDEVDLDIRTWLNLIHPNDRSRVIEIMNRQLTDSTDVYHTEHRLKTKSGEWKWIQHRGKVVERDQDGIPLRALGTYLDITERNRMEEDLRESDQFNRSILEHSPMAIVYFSTGGIIEYTNPASNRMFGVPEGQESPLLGFKIFDLPLIA